MILPTFKLFKQDNVNYYKILQQTQKKSPKMKARKANANEGDNSLLWCIFFTLVARAWTMICILEPVRLRVAF